MCGNVSRCEESGRCAHSALQLASNKPLGAAAVQLFDHLAYIQQRIGYRVKLDMPMLKGAVVDELYRRGARWLAGEDLAR